MLNNTRISPSFLYRIMSEAEDWFMWATEGLLLMAVGTVGMAGNACSIVVFARQRVQVKKDGYQDVHFEGESLCPPLSPCRGFSTTSFSCWPYSTR